MHISSVCSARLRKNYAQLSSCNSYGWFQVLYFFQLSILVCLEDRDASNFLENQFLIYKDYHGRSYLGRIKSVNEGYRESDTNRQISRYQTTKFRLKGGLNTVDFWKFSKDNIFLHEIITIAWNLEIIKEVLGIMFSSTSMTNNDYASSSILIFLNCCRRPILFQRINFHIHVYKCL